LTEGLNVRNRHVGVFDLDNTITHVTVKDIPVELSDSFIVTHMAKYGDVVQNSIKRGKIPGTEIETGTRYLNLTNRKGPIPNLAQFNEYDVRIFADNNAQECGYCKSTSHTQFRCPEKPKPVRRCYNCSATDHIARDCVEEKGERHRLGEYAAEIFEGRQHLNIEQTGSRRSHYEHQSPSRDRKSQHASPSRVRGNRSQSRDWRTPLGGQRAVNTDR
jgi:hypothetical protein